MTTVETLVIPLPLAVAMTDADLVVRSLEQC